MPNDPLLRSIDPSTGQPYEWQFAASHVDRALDHTAGDPSIVVGIIDSGVDAVPDLAGKLDGLWSVSATARSPRTRSRPATTTTAMAPPSRR